MNTYVNRVLERTVAWIGYPAKPKMDNGPKLISTNLPEWAEEHEVELEFIQPGKPTQNTIAKRFNRTLRDAVLNMHVFRTLSDVREITEDWITEYNDEQPLDSLGDFTPYEYMGTSKQPDNSRLLSA